MGTVLGVNGIRLVGKRAGVGRYVEHILRCWAEQSPPFDEIRVYSPEPLGESVEFHPAMRQTPLPTGLPRGLWEQITLPHAHGRAGVLFCPSYVAPLAARSPVLLVHHGSYEAYPAAFPWRTRVKAYHLYRASARKADILVTVSESSKRDILRFYGVPESKIRVLPEGVDTRQFHPIADPNLLADFRRELLGEDEPYILYVGNSNPRRNVAAMLAAYAQLLREGRTRHRFVFIGSALSGVPVPPILRELGLEQNVKLVGHLPHDRIALAYNAADLFIYPSSYEGFGMPVLEAMACGTPAVSLANTAFLEFAKGVALLAENAEPATLARAMETALTDESLRAQMRRDGPERARAYDWRGIARETMELIKTLA